MAVYMDSEPPFEGYHKGFSRIRTLRILGIRAINVVIKNGICIQGKRRNAWFLFCALRSVAYDSNAVCQSRRRRMD